MSSADRLYRVRVAAAGEDEVTDLTVEFTLTVSDLHGVPVVTTQIVHPMQGKAESRPFSIEVLDTDAGLLANLTSSERWDALGRILDVQFSDNAGVDWTTYGTGRISGLSESDGPGKFLIEVSDEGWKARKSKIFEVADTTQLWPHGIKARWGEYGAAVPADGTRVASNGDLYRIKLVANEGRPLARHIFPALQRFVDRDMKGTEERVYSAPEATAAGAGNFETLRLNYDGIDFEVVSLGPIGTQNDLVSGLENPVIEAGADASVTIHVRIFSTTLPPATGKGFLHAPTAEPSEDNPLHVGLADAAHTWGIADVGDLLPQEIHPATLTRIYWDETGQVYDNVALTALENDTSFRAIAPRITETPKNPDAWFHKHVWGPSMMAVLVSGDGKRRLVDMRQPQDEDPNLLPVIDASSAKKNTWRLLGREAVNSVTWKLLELFENDQLVGRAQQDASADGIIATVVERGPFEGDTIGTLGTRSLTIEAPALHLYRETPFTNRHRGRERFPEVQSEELFGIFQDGAWRGSVEVGRTLAETLEEGDLALLDQDSLKGPNPQTEARTGKRVVRILTMERHPAHAVTTYLDLGKDAQPLAAPTISVAQDAGDPEVVNVTVSNIPVGAQAIVAFGYSDSATLPTEWSFLRVTGAGKTYVFRDAAGEAWAHARAKSIARGRISSPWASGNVQLNTRPKITGQRVELDGAEPVVFGDPDANAGGVRIRYDVHNPGDDPAPANAADFDATNLSGGIALDGVVVGDEQVITAELEPWTGFSAGSVTGSAGPKVSASAAGLAVIQKAVEIQATTWIPDPDVKHADLKITLKVGAATQSLRVVYKDSTGSVVERYDLNVTPDTSFIHTLQDAALDALDPSGAPKEINALQADPGSLEITPYDAADGGQGTGNAGSTVAYQLVDALGLWQTPSKTGAFLAGETVDGDLVYTEADYPVQRTEPTDRSFMTHPGTGGGAGQTAEWGGLGRLVDVQDDGTPILSLLGDAELYGDLSAAADIKTILEAARDDLLTRFPNADKRVIQLGPEQLTLSQFVFKNNTYLHLMGTQLVAPADNHTVEDSGTAESATSTTLTDTDKVFTADQFADEQHAVHITGGTGAGQVREIFGNTTDTVEIHADEPWTTTPDGTSTYEIVKAIHMFTLLDENVEKAGITGAGKCFGNKANQKAPNRCISWDNTGGGPFDTGDMEHVVVPDHLHIKEFKGDGIWMKVSRECRVQNVVAQSCDGYGFQFRTTDGIYSNLTSSGAGKSSFFNGGLGDKYTQCKGLGGGQRAITGDGRGFLVTQPRQIFTNCHAQECREQGVLFLNADQCRWTGRVDLCGGGGIRFDNSDRCLASFTAESYSGFAFTQPNGVEFTGGSEDNRVYMATKNLTSEDVVGGDPGDNYVEINDRSMGRHFNKYGAVGADAHEHFAFGKAESPASGNPYYVFQTSADAVPLALFQGFDGTTTHTFWKADFDGAELLLGDVAPVDVRVAAGFQVDGASTMVGAVTMQSTLEVTGNVGIGTTGPSQPLSVGTNVAARSPSFTQAIIFKGIEVYGEGDVASELRSNHASGTTWQVAQIVSSGVAGRFRISEIGVGEHFNIAKGGAAKFTSTLNVDGGINNPFFVTNAGNLSLQMRYASAGNAVDLQVQDDVGTLKALLRLKGDGTLEWADRDPTNVPLFAAGSAGAGIPSGNKFFFDGTGLSGNSYVWERSANDVRVSAGGSEYQFHPNRFVPVDDNVRTLGLTNLRWSTIYGVGLDLSGTGTMGGAASGALVTAAKLQNTGAAAAGSKAGLAFLNQVTTTGQVTAGRIEVGMTDVGSSTWASDMIFYTAEGGALAEAGRFSPSGFLGVQSPATPEAMLHVGNEAGSPFGTSTIGGIFEAEGSAAGTQEHGYGFYFLKSATPATSLHGLDIRLEASHGSTSVAPTGLRVISQYTGTGTLSNGNSLIGGRFLAWANNASATLTTIVSVLIDDPIATAGASITNATTLILDAPSSVGSSLNRTLFLSDPSGTGAETIAAASGAKLTTGGVWTDAPSFSWLKTNVEHVPHDLARDVLLAMQPILYDRIDNGETGLGFALDQLPEWLRYMSGRLPDGMEGVVPMHYVTLLTAGWQEHERRLQDHESRISQLEARGNA